MKRHRRKKSTLNGETLEQLSSEVKQKNKSMQSGSAKNWQAEINRKKNQNRVKVLTTYFSPQGHSEIT